MWSNSVCLTEGLAAAWSGPSGVSVSTSSARSLRGQMSATWPGWSSEPSGFGLSAVSSPRSMNRRTANDVTFAFWWLPTLPSLHRGTDPAETVGRARVEVMTEAVSGGTA